VPTSSMPKEPLREITKEGKKKILNKRREGEFTMPPFATEKERKGSFQGEGEFLIFIGLGGEFSSCQTNLDEGRVEMS